MNIITRFAPSPTGNFHIGSARTAFLCWIYSIKNNGKFFIRIEDTDNIRSHNKYTKNILESLQWLGIQTKEQISFQSNNLVVYQNFAERLLKENKAYKCFCSKERIERLKDIQIKNNIKPKYDNFCRNYNNKNNNSNYVIRFKNPEKGFVYFYDTILGLIKIHNTELDDLIIIKSNGFPSYNFSSVIDDILINTTHIIRGNDHINNTLRQINIINSLKKDIPKYCHIPILLDENKKKISKRNLNFSILDLKKKGYFKESIINYIFQMGYKNSSNNIFSINNIIKKFNIKHISKSNVCINMKQLTYFNKKVLLSSSIHYVVEELKDILNIDIYKKQDIDIINIIDIYRKQCCDLVQLSNIIKNIFFSNFNKDNLKILKNNHLYINFFINTIKKISINDWYERVLKNKLFEYNMEKKNIYSIIRICLLNINESPSIIKIIQYLGKKEVLKRLEKIQNIISIKY